MVEMEVYLQKKISFKGYTLLIAFPSTGLVGVIAAKHLIDKMKAKEIGTIRSDAFAPIVLIEGGLLKEPVRIYMCPKSKCAIVTSEQLFNKFEVLHNFATSLATWAKKEGFKQVYSVSGILVGGPEPEKRDIVFGVATDKKSLTTLKGAGIKILNEGISTGISPLILLECMERKLPAAQILGEISYTKDYQAASDVVLVLNKLLNLNVDITKLNEEAKDMKKQLDKSVSRLETAKKQIAKGDQGQSLMYG